MNNILNITDRADFRRWLAANSATEKECWIAVKRGKTPQEDAPWHFVAVEKALYSIHTLYLHTSTCPT